MNAELIKPFHHAFTGEENKTNVFSEFKIWPYTLKIENL